MFGGNLVGGQRAAPELVEVSPELAETILIHLVDATVARGPVDHQAGLLQHLEVLRDGRPANRQPAGDLTDRARAASDALKDLPSRPIA
jgi:hypothetical protein